MDFPLLTAVSRSWPHGYATIDELVVRVYGENRHRVIIHRHENHT